MCKNTPHPKNNSFVSVCPTMGTKGKMLLETASKISKAHLEKNAARKRNVRS